MEDSGALKFFSKSDSTDLRVEVLLKVQLLFQGLDAVLSIHPPQHLILKLLPGISQTGLKLKDQQQRNINMNNQM